MVSNSQQLEEIKREFTRCKNDPCYFISRYIKVVHPIRGMVSFDLYPFQQRIVKEFQTHRFNILRKFRQAGASTITGAYALWFVIFNNNKKVAILSKGDEEAKELLGRIKVMYEELPAFLRPAAKKNNDHRLDLENGSTIQSKASGKQSGRSLSCSLLIIDECAFIEHIETIWSSAAPVISTGGSVFLISTVNGIGNFYHRMWTQAVNNENGFNPINIHWKEHPEYFRTPGYEAIYKDLESRTPPINVDDWEKTTKKRHTLKEWLSEYEAEFLGTGDTYIDGEILRSLKENCNNDFNIKYNNRMRIWQDPKPHHEYVLACDPSIGRERDFSAFHIFDLYNGEQVAEFYSNRTPLNEFAKIIVDEARLYNTAFVLSERNTIGTNLLFFLKETYEYENLMMDDNRELGIQITQKNRENLLAAMEHAIRSNRIKINSERLIDELLTFVMDPETGKIEADTNCHDDLVMSLSIAVHAFNNIVGSTPMERDSLADKLTILPTQVFNYKYKMKTATGGVTEEDIRWLLS